MSDADGAEGTPDPKKPAPEAPQGPGASGDAQDPARDPAEGGEKARQLSPASMTVLEHIAELRTTLLWMLAIAFAAAIVAWFFSDEIVAALLRPAKAAGQDTLYFQKPMEAFMLKLKASAVVGLFFAFPLILHRLYRFVLPGLLPQEKGVVTPLLVAGTGLFYTGISFCYLVLLPMVIRFALGFATDDLQPWLTADAYFGMAARLCFAFGILFELPMVIFALSWVGLVDPKVLLKAWRYALVLILVASAALTPPDPVSQVLLAGPVMLLYMVSVLISLVVRRRRDKKRALKREEEDAFDREWEEREEQRRREDEGQSGETSEARETSDADDRTGESASKSSQDPRSEAGPQPRPAEGATPRGADLEEAPDRDDAADAEDPPWVRPDRGQTSDSADEPGASDESRGPERGEEDDSGDEGDRRE